MVSITRREISVHQQTVLFTEKGEIVTGTGCSYVAIRKTYMPAKVSGNSRLKDRSVSMLTLLHYVTDKQHLHFNTILFSVENVYNIDKRPIHCHIIPVIQYLLGR